MIHNAQDGVRNGQCSIGLKGVKIGLTSLGGKLTIVEIIRRSLFKKHTL